MSSSEADAVFAKGSSKFSMNLYSKLVQSGENIIFSPFSIQTCVALVHAAAVGTTADEIAVGLCLPSKEKTEVEKTFENILNAYKDNNLIKIANKIYIKTGYELKPEFNEIAIKSFHSEAENVDFGNSTSAANTINSWVETKTNNKIKNLIDPSSLDSDTSAILVNAIYFKAPWKYPFDLKHTQKDKFYINEEDSVEVDMMYTEHNFEYGEFENLDATAIEMPYDNSDLSMIIVLPNKKTGIKDLEKKLSSLNLADLTKDMESEKVIVNLPRFKIEFSAELIEPLKQLGIKQIFRNDADLSIFSETKEPLKVSEVVHKAFIEVNEEGTEAAAATKAQLFAISFDPCEYFTANKPFLLFLKSNRTIFFVGRVMKPVSNNNSKSNRINNSNNENDNNNNKRCNCSHKQPKYT